MRMAFCLREKRLMRLLMQNRVDEDPKLLVHARNCPVCSDTLMAVAALRQSRARTIGSAGAMSPHDLWRRAAWRRQRFILEQVTRPVVWAEKLALAGMLCTGAGLACMQRREIAGWFGKVPKVHLGELWTESAGSVDPVWLYALAGLAVLACLGALLLRFSEE